jgi:hypothetical protein
MVSAIASEKLKAEVNATMYDFDPGGTDPVDVGWVDMRDYETILIGVMVSVGTGGIAAFKILANPASDGSGTDVEVKAHADPTVADAVGDTVWLEATTADIQAVGDNLRYVSGSVDLVTGTDECVVTYIRRGLHRKTGLTADVIA